jgi:hypothetical protein
VFCEQSRLRHLHILIAPEMNRAPKKNYKSNRNINVSIATTTESRMGLRTLTPAELAAVDGSGAVWPFIRDWWIAMGMDPYEVALRDFAAENGHDLSNVSDPRGPGPWAP